jgi:hypothetical protein
MNVDPRLSDPARAQGLIEYAVRNRLPFAMMLKADVLNEVGWGGPAIRPEGVEAGLIVIAIDDVTYAALERANEPPQVQANHMTIVLGFGNRVMRCDIPWRAVHQVVFVLDVRGAPPPRPTLRLVSDNSNRQDIDA